ncbi:hypothetical protein [Psychrobacter alimentarius]|uniref:hypothetical protein n=1 Tax=Psychrobacter alimentarius TaxID=261164 RepID=UPI00191924EA|nr:hypothetical protein [Psychrobacter alimentarius]
MNIEDMEGLDEETRKEIERLQGITREKYGNQIFAGSLFSIGKILYENDYIKDALDVWQGIDINDEPEIYANALFEIGKCVLPRKSLKIEDLDKPIRVWEKIERMYSTETYARAQHGIMLMHSIRGDFKQALITLDNILYTDCPTTFARANYFLGTELIKKKLFSEAYIASPLFMKSIELFPYESSCYRKICDLSVSVETQIIGNLYLQLFNKVLSIVDILKLDFGSSLIEEKSSERKLAHYTSTHTTNLLLSLDEKNELPSSFRLNTINNVNDPSEGQLLINYLKSIKIGSFYAPDFDENLHAFISCFTFNHDSLNQFRLYGKKDNKEASGVSLVFKKEFFQSESTKDGLSFLAFQDELQNSDKFYVKQSIEDSNLDQSFQANKIANKQPVMRCVYLDPTSNYIQLAQRNQLTFYREFGDEKFTFENRDGVREEIIWADIEWEKYKFEINKKTKDFKKAFKELKEIYILLNREKENLDSIELKNLNDTNDLLDEILLPLKYLIKHSAFQEEQECRMVYITSLKEKKVQIEFGKFMYIEYDVDVKLNLDKIYIAPAAIQYQPYLAKLLCDTDVKIELSNNPYRQT